MPVEIPVFLAANNNYLPYAAVTIKSMLETKKPETIYNIHILHSESQLYLKHQIMNFSRDDLKISFYNISESVAPIKEFLYTRAHFSREMYYRWWISQCFPKLNKAIYVDCDVVLAHDLLTLYQCDITDAAVGGVIDFATPSVANRIQQQLGLNAMEYINSGVLLLNTEVWRNECIADKCVALLKERKDLICPDQDVLNLVCSKRIIFLDPRWNAQWHHIWDKAENQLAEPFASMFSTAINDPWILHYSSPNKPWNCHEEKYSSLFWRYAQSIPFIDFPDINTCS